jgi:hypothetical protein
VLLLYEVLCLFVFIFLVVIWKKLPIFVCRRSNHLGFQHYFTMLGTTVLIPSLVIFNINGHSVCSSGETLTDRHRK